MDQRLLDQTMPRTQRGSNRERIPKGEEAEIAIRNRARPARID
jgi:hypothetical protein